MGVRHRAVENLEMTPFWDGKRVLEEDTLVIQGHKIVGLTHHDNLAAATPTRDCSGLSAIPGLIDAHVHLELNPDDKDAPMRTTPAVIPLMAQRARVRFVDGGDFHGILE